MKLPAGTTEQEFVEIVDRVMRTLAPKFRFGFHEAEDMKQQGALFAVEVLGKEKYDAARPLENFLYTHIRNRLINFKRDNYVRNEPPCKTCIFFHKNRANPCAAFDSQGECEKYEEWRKNAEAKKNIIRPVDIDAVGDLRGFALELHSGIDDAEMEGRINAELPLELRSDYLRMRANLRVPKARKEKVQEALRAILGANAPEGDYDA